MGWWRISLDAADRRGQCTIHVAREHGQRQLVRGETDFAHTHGRPLIDRRQFSDPPERGRIDESALPRAARAHVYVGRQDILEPAFERTAKRADHDQHRSHQAEADDDRRDADAELIVDAAKLLDGNQRDGIAHAWQPREKSLGYERDEPQRTREHGSNGCVSAERKIVDRRNHRQRYRDDEQRQSRPRRTPARHRFGDVGGLECRRRRLGRGLARGHEAAGDRRADAKREVQRNDPRIPAERDRNPAEISCPEIAAESRQGNPCESRPNRNSQRGANRTDERALRDENANDAAARDAEHAKDRDLGAPLQNRQRLRREDQERSGEQRDQREHVEIDPIRACHRDGVLRFGIDARHMHARRQDRRDARRHRPPIGARRESKVDPIDRAQPSQAPLSRRDIGIRDPLRRRSFHRQHSDYRHRERRGARLHRDALAGRYAEPVGRRATQEDRVGIEKALHVRHAITEEPRLDSQRLERIECEQMHRALPREAQIELDHRTRDVDFGHRRDPRIDRLVESTERTANREIGIARKLPRRGVELADGRSVDQVHRDPERDPQRDADHRQQQPPSVRVPRIGRQRERGERRVTRDHLHCGDRPLEVKISVRCAVAAAACE